MFHLIYVSTAVESMGEEALLNLLIQSRGRNLKHRITGMLLYKDGHFMEVLEGNEKDVMKIFHDIEKDPRHKSVDVLRAEYILHRNFPDWSMGFTNVDALDPNAIAGYTRFLDVDFRAEYFAEDVSEAHAMLLAFKRCAE